MTPLFQQFYLRITQELGSFLGKQVSSAQPRSQAPPFDKLIQPIYTLCTLIKLLTWLVDKFASLTMS